MNVQQIQIKLEGMKNGSFTYADQTHLVASYKVNAIDKQFELKTNLKTFKRHFTEAENFFSRFVQNGEAAVVEKEKAKAEVVEALPATVEIKTESNLGIADELVKILKDNINKVKADAKFIPQAQQISNSVNQIINIERLRLDMVKHAGLKPKINGNANDNN